MVRGQHLNAEIKTVNEIELVNQKQPIIGKLKVLYTFIKEI